MLIVREEKEEGFFYKGGMYLQKKENVFIWDIKKAKHLSRFLGLQLPTAWTNLDFINKVM